MTVVANFCGGSDRVGFSFYTWLWDGVGLSHEVGGLVGLIKEKMRSTANSDVMLACIISLAPSCRLLVMSLCLRWDALQLQLSSEFHRFTYLSPDKLPFRFNY